MVRTAKVLTAVLIATTVATGTAVAASSPSVRTGSVSHVGQLSVVLHGAVNPNREKTRYLFQWGLTTAYGLQSVAHSAGAGRRTVAVAAAVRGLIPGTVYHYRLLASNRSGGTTGADHTFKTAGPPPAGVETGAATQLSSTSATATGIVNPNRATTTWTFQYGPTVFLGSQTFGGVVSGKSGPVEVTSPLQGLTPGAIFHYRLIAIHPHNIISYGSDETFMTFPTVRPRPVVSAHTNPRHPRHKPFLLNTSGTVHPPSSIPGAFACSGQLTVRFMFKRHDISDQIVGLQPNCTFSAETGFHVRPGVGHHRPPATVHVIVHFFGNGYLAPAGHRSERKIVLG